MRIALAQFLPAWDDPHTNLRAVDEAAGNSADEGAALLVLAVATSIDALAVGLSLAVVTPAIVLPAALIGLVSFVLTIAGAKPLERAFSVTEHFAAFDESGLADKDRERELQGLVADLLSPATV